MLLAVDSGKKKDDGDSDASGPLLPHPVLSHSASSASITSSSSGASPTQSSSSAATGSKQKATRLIFLDGLRGLFALLVVFQHLVTDVNGLCNWSFLGRLGTHVAVPGFFALSSYLLTFNLHHQMQKVFTCLWDFLKPNSRINLAVCMVKYTIKRVLRIMPPFIFVTMLGKDILPPLLAPGTGHFPPVTYYDLITLKTAGLTVFWTIPVEMRYYLFLPLYVFLVHISSWFVPLIAMASLFLEAKEQPLDHPELNIRCFFRTFLVGSFLGTFHYWTRKAMDRPDTVYPFSSSTVRFYLLVWDRMGVWGRWIWKWVVDFGILAMTAYSVSFLPPYVEARWVWTGNWAGAYVVVLIIACMNSPDSLITRGLTNDVLMYYGKISFSVYLLHMVVHRYYVHHVSRTPTVEHVLYQLVITTVLSHWMFHFLEKPLIDFAEWLCRKVMAFAERPPAVEKVVKTKGQEPLLPS
ncbi:hypothetical protein HDU67_006771 [Dinochytrium kinnereticum]|nr:hypothetical protein HDU67_006771 [Dinochytrium kinnereticum]